jgi:Tetratricopeptide repeat
MLSQQNLRSQHRSWAYSDEKGAGLLVGWQPPLLSKAADYEFVGPLPPELQDPKHSTWTAGAATEAADPGAAKGFTQEPDLASCLNNLSIRLGDMGDGSGALAAIREAVEIRQTRRASSPTWQTASTICPTG